MQNTDGIVVGAVHARWTLWGHVKFLHPRPSSMTLICAVKVASGSPTGRRAQLVGRGAHLVGLEGSGGTPHVTLRARQCLIVLLHPPLQCLSVRRCPLPVLLRTVSDPRSVPKSLGVISWGSGFMVRPLSLCAVARSHSARHSGFTLSTGTINF